MPNANDGDDSDREAFIQQMSTQIPHVLDEPAEIWAEYGVTSQPTMVFVDAGGGVDVHVGGLGPQALLARSRELLQG